MFIVAGLVVIGYCVLCIVYRIMVYCFIALAIALVIVIVIAVVIVSATVVFSV